MPWGVRNKTRLLKGVLLFQWGVIEARFDRAFYAPRRRRTLCGSWCGHEQKFFFKKTGSNSWNSNPSPDWKLWKTQIRRKPKMKPYLKWWQSAQPQVATNRNASSPAAIPLVHLQVCRELVIFLSSAPMFSPLFISSSLSPSRLHLPWFSPFSSLSAADTEARLSLCSRLFINLFIYFLSN